MTSLLPLLADDACGGHGATPRVRHGSRSLTVCRYKCGNACDKPIANTSANDTFRSIAERALARRTVLSGMAAGAGAMVVGGLAQPAAAAPAAAGRQAPTDLGRVRFTPVAPNRDDKVSVPEGFRSDVLIRWGDPVLASAPAFDPAAQTPAAARKQFGYNNDYVGVLPLRGAEALLVCNHEYTNEPLMFPETMDPETAKLVAMASHGMSVVKIRRRAKRKGYKVAPLANPFNRRIHVGTEFRLDGPAAGSERLRTVADPSGRRVYGTLNNCAGGLTPWGTVLSGEENFNQYFMATSGQLPAQNAAGLQRLGFATESERGWETVDSRFDMDVEPNEPNRFGWIVELDPYDKDSVPRKHTMLGRFKHEGANVTVAPNGRVVAYMGDDERFDYLYKFVSAEKMLPGSSARAKRHNMQLLTTGTLYVARLSDEAEDAAPEYDGTGRWIPLCSDTESYVEGMSVADVLIDTRLAADTVSPTKMDRPEDVEVNPVNGRVYAALTNNSNRGQGDNPGPDEANPLTSSTTRATLDGPTATSSGNRNGYVLEMTPRNGNHLQDRFTWTLMLVCGDPDAPETYFAGFPKDKVSPISCPDNVAFDAAGNLWVSTDGNQLGSNDGLFRVPVSGRRRGKVEQFLTVPLGAECCGPFITDDQQTVLVAVQHPGDTAGSTYATPSSTFPNGSPVPRPSVTVQYLA